MCITRRKRAISALGCFHQQVVRVSVWLWGRLTAYAEKLLSLRRVKALARVEYFSTARHGAVRVWRRDERTRLHVDFVATHAAAIPPIGSVVLAELPPQKVMT
jgi:hypothetical protein